MTNKWPPESFRPGLKGDTVAFFNQMDAISDKLSQALCDMIGLPKDALARRSYAHVCVCVRVCVCACVRVCAQ